MGEYNDVICVTRYCPHCGTEIFCRTDAGSHKVFYLSEDMVDPTDTCPRCQFNLMSFPSEALLYEPDRGREGGTSPRKLGARAKMVERVLKNDPQAFSSKAAARRAVNDVGAVVFDMLASGESVRWTGLGSFKIRERKPRKARNPQTGEELQIPAKRVVKFSAASALRKRLNG